VYIIPFQVSETEYSVFLVLNDGNIDRIKAYDPAEFAPEKVGKEFYPFKLKNIVVGYCTDEEERELKTLRDYRAVQTFLRRLSRGFKYKPESGDSDEPYQSQIPKDPK
jgi:hypothetical protein